MKSLSIVMAVSALAIFSTPASANPHTIQYKGQNALQVSQSSRLSASESITLSFDNRVDKADEKEIYAKIMSGAKEKGVELTEEQALKLAHIVNAAFENPSPAAKARGRWSIKISISLGKPITIGIEISGPH